MKFHSIPLTAIIVVALILTVTVSARSEEENTLTQKDLPKSVLAAFREVYPNAVITSIESETEDSVACFGIGFKNGDVERDALYTAGGVLRQTDEKVAPSALPAAVRTTLTKKFPKYEITEASLKTVGSTSVYEITVEKGKKGFELVISQDGSILKDHKMSTDEEKNESGAKKIGKKASAKEKDEGDEGGEDKD